MEKKGNINAPAPVFRIWTQDHFNVPVLTKYSGQSIRSDFPETTSFHDLPAFEVKPK